MAYPDPRRPYVLHTDASGSELGAVPYQEQEKVLRLIANLNTSRTGKMQFLALKWAICGQFRGYLYYPSSFVVYTGNNHLTYVLSAAKHSPSLDSSDIHDVIKRKGPEYPVYEIKPKKDEGRKNRLVHRNLLVSCDYLPSDENKPARKDYLESYRSDHNPNLACHTVMKHLATMKTPKHDYL